MYPKPYSIYSRGAISASKQIKPELLREPRPIIVLAQTSSRSTCTICGGLIHRV